MLFRSPSTIVSRTAEYDDATGAVEFDDAVTLSNIRWKECNCQILTLADLYRDGNRPLAASVRAEGVTGTMTFDYGADGGYTGRFVGTEDGARYENCIVYEPLDGNGSFRRTERERNFTEGYEDMESLLERYDRFGICTELLRESTSTDPPFLMACPVLKVLMSESMRRSIVCTRFTSSVRSANSNSSWSEKSSSSSSRVVR